MSLAQQDSQGRYLRERTRAAISLATESRWEEAVRVNHAVLQVAPQDAEAHNRLGKALMELGQYQEAREAFRQALTLKPSNTIARKNLERLNRLETAPRVGRGERVHPSLFVEESGKTCAITLQGLASRETVAALAAGESVSLIPQGNTVWVASPSGERLGYLEPRLGLRLSRLLQGGNRYAAIVTSVGERGVAIIIRETYQHPSQERIVSFPGKAAEGYPPPLADIHTLYEREDGDELVPEPDALEDEEPDSDDADHSPLSHTRSNDDEEEEF